MFNMLPGSPPQYNTTPDFYYGKVHNYTCIKFMNFDEPIFLGDDSWWGFFPGILPSRIRPECTRIQPPDSITGSSLLVIHQVNSHMTCM